MEDKIITVTPAAFQMLFLLWSGFYNLRLYASDHRLGYLVLGVVALVLMPFLVRRFATVWCAVSKSQMVV